VSELLDGAGPRAAARRIAAAMAELPPPDAAVGVLAALARH
jgi:hypothetical protein